MDRGGSGNRGSSGEDVDAPRERLALSDPREHDDVERPSRSPPRHAAESDDAEALRNAISFGLKLTEDLEVIKGECLRVRNENATLRRDCAAALENAEQLTEERVRL